MKIPNIFKTKKAKALIEFEKYIVIRDKCRKHQRWAEEMALKYWIIAYPEKYSNPKPWKYKEGDDAEKKE